MAFKKVTLLDVPHGFAARWAIAPYTRSTHSTRLILLHPLLIYDYIKISGKNCDPPAPSPREHASPFKIRSAPDCIGCLFRLFPHECGRCLNSLAPPDWRVALPRDYGAEWDLCPVGRDEYFLTKRAQRTKGFPCIPCLPRFPEVSRPDTVSVSGQGCHGPAHFAFACARGGKIRGLCA